MTDSEPEPQEQTNWLAHQWQRVRGQAKRDVIIAQVGDDAENIAVGKNIWQINIAGRNLTIPVFIATACLLSIVGYFLFRQYEYLWNPSQMTGTFRIAVAEFGEVKKNGKVGYSEHGESLSKTVFDSIQQQYEEHPTIDSNDITIWHDSLGRETKNVQISVITGRNSAEREEQARAVANKISADLVIYGQLDSTDSPDSLELEFFYRSKKVSNEYDLTHGQHRAGKPILVSPSFTDDPSLARLQIGEPLEARAKVLSLIAIGLTYDVLGDVNNSLVQFQIAKDQHLQFEEDDSGLESVNYFVGRAALFQGDDATAEEAFTQAIALDANYTQAYIGLGSVYLARAQRVDARVHLQNLGDLERAIEYYRMGESLASESNDVLHQSIAKLGLGQAYRVRGEASFRAEKGTSNRDEDAVALNFFEQAIDELTQIEDSFEQSEQYRLWAQTLQSKGIAYLQSALLFREEGDETTAKQFLNQAAEAFHQCNNQQLNAPEDKILTKKILTNKALAKQNLDGSCQPLFEQTIGLLASSKES